MIAIGEIMNIAVNDLVQIADDAPLLSHVRKRLEGRTGKVIAAWDPINGQPSFWEQCTVLFEGAGRKQAVTVDLMLKWVTKVSDQIQSEKLRETPSNTLQYLASPYTHDDPDVMQARKLAVCRKAGELISRGIAVLSPIAHNCAIVEKFGGHTGWNHWKQQDRAMLRACSKLLVLKLEGWEQSKGVAEEIKIALEFGIPIEYIESSVAEDADSLILSISGDVDLTEPFFTDAQLLFLKDNNVQNWKLPLIKRFLAQNPICLVAKMFGVTELQLLKQLVFNASKMKPDDKFLSDPDFRSRNRTL